MVQEYERAVIFRLGRLLQGGSKGPGMQFTYGHFPLCFLTYTSCSNSHDLLRFEPKFSFFTNLSACKQLSTSFEIVSKTSNDVKPERIYNPIMAMGFSAMFTFQLDNNKR